MNILGIFNAYNSGVCISIKDEIVFAVSEERLSREKFHIGFPHLSLDVGLRKTNLKPSDIDVVSYGGYRGPGLDAVSDFLSCSRVAKNNVYPERLAVTLDVDRSYVVDFYRNIFQKFLLQWFMVQKMRLCL